jgi:hypothetical protein
MSLIDYIEQKEGVKFDDDANYTPTSTSSNYSVTDFSNDPLVKRQFDIITDYLAENKTAASRLLDAGATMGEQDDPVEFARDDLYRIGAPAAKALIFKDAPENVKEAYRIFRDKFEAASVTGTGEVLGAIKDIGSDMIFNPEMIMTLGSVLAAPSTLGGSFVASQAAKKAAGSAARNKLKHAIAASGAAIKNNPKKFATAMGAYYGGAGDLAMQSQEVALDEVDAINPLRAGISTTAGAAFGYGLYRAGSAIGNKYFQKATDGDAKVPTEKAAQLYDEAAEGELLPKSANELLEQLELKLSDDVATKPKKPKTPKGLAGVWKLPPKQGELDFGEPVEQAVNKLVGDLGGGEKTKKEILSKIRALANGEETVEGARNQLKQTIYETAADLTGNMFGKAAGVLSPHLRLSGTARQLQERLSYEFGIKSSVEAQQRVGQDLSEVQREVNGHFNEKFRVIVDEVGLANKDGSLSQAINDALMITLRSNKAVQHEGLDSATNRAVNKAAQATKELYNEMGVSLKQIGAIDKLVDNYIPRMWDRKAIEDNQTDFMNLLVQKAGLSPTEAKRTVDNMLDIKNQIDTGGGTGYFFSSQRKLVDIGEDAAFQKYLNDDVLGSLHAYTFQASKAIAKHRVLGVNNVDEFNKFWVNRIREEITKGGGKFTAAHAKQIESLYKHATGEGLDRYGKVGQNLADAYGLTTRIAYLGLATVSSLTEVMLNLSRGGLTNSVKGLKDAMNISHKYITSDLQSKLTDEYGLTAAEALSEMRKFSININQNMAQLGNRLAGDDLVNEGMQNASNKFFRANMLDQWTRFVQTVSFSTGKRMIRENLEALAAYKNGPLDRVGKGLVDELKELDIDYKEGVAWLNAGGKLNSKFYNESLLRGAARYTDSVILQPTAMSGLKPLLHSNPKTGILFQLLGYPMAFTNTVLKQTGKRIAKNPMRNLYKTLPAAFLMTGMARWTNYLRTDGESERNKELPEILTDSLARWGGNGVFLDMLQRARENAKYSNSNAPYVTLPFGPMASDVMSVYNRGIIPTLANKVPVYSGSYFGKQLLGDEEVQHYKRSATQLQKDVFDRFIPEFEAEPAPVGYAIGGIVGGKTGAKIVDMLDLNSVVKKVVTDATDGVLNSKARKKSAAEIKQGLTDLQNEGAVDLSNNDTLDFVNSLIVNEIRKRDLPLTELEKNPKWKKAVNSKDPDEMEANWTEFQDSAGFSEAHKYALKTIGQRQMELDPEGKLSYAVSNIVRNTRNKYQEHLKPEVKIFVDKQQSGFYSPLHKAALALEGSKPKAGQYWLNQLKKAKGVTKDELDWTGAEKVFGNQKPVTKEQVVEYFEDTKFDLEINQGTTSPDYVNPNDVDVDFNIDLDDPEDFVYFWLRDNSPEELEGIDDLSAEAYEELAESVFVRAEAQTSKDTPKVPEIPKGFDFRAQQMHLNYAFEGYDTKNYRELVISLPDKFKKLKLDFEHDHFPALKNFVSHVRLADVRPVDSKAKTLLIDEIQSDVHQKAKGKYITDQKEYDDKFQAMIKLEGEKFQIEDILEDLEMNYEYNKISKEEFETNQKAASYALAKVEKELEKYSTVGYVPSLPFKDEKQWALVGLKQAMIEAAKGNYNQVALTTGKIQGLRNKQMHEVDNIFITEYENGNVRVQGTNENAIERTEVNKKFNSKKEAQNYVGKERYDLITDSNPVNVTDKYSFYQAGYGNKTILGGNKQLEFYDKTLISLLNKHFADKYKVKIKLKKIYRNDETVTLPVMEITEKMRRDILEGLPMFAEGGLVTNSK